MTVKIAKIYDRLFDYESKTKIGRGEQFYPIHKKLQFSEENYHDISDWIIGHFPIKEGEFILDAGCGVGYVLIRICTIQNCTGLGISLSQKEIKFATEKCKILGLYKKVSFEQKSFDEKTDKQFDVIIAIESIKHSESVLDTIEILVKQLSPSGRIFILDDYETDLRFQFLKKQVKKFWAVDSIYKLSTVKEKLTELKISFEVIDFTSNVEYTKKRFTGLKVILGYLFLMIVRPFGFFKIYNIFFAGLCLERLYKIKALEYKAIIATKN